MVVVYGVDVEDQTQDGRIDLGNSNTEELVNQIIVGLYEGHRDGKTSADIFDFTNVEKNFTLQGWGGSGVYKGKFVINGVTLTVALVKPLKSTPLPIIVKVPENINGTPNPDKYPGTVAGKKVSFPFLYSFYDNDKGTVARFEFYRTDAKAYSSFISYMNTGKSEHLIGIFNNSLSPKN